MRFSVLGPIEATVGDLRVRLGPPQRQAVLAALLLDANRVVSDEVLTSSLWVIPPATATAQLRQHVSALRRVLGAGMIVRRASGYLIKVEPGQLDLEVFTQRTDRARKALADGRPPEAAQLLRLALRQWRGEALGGACREFADRAEPALRERRLAALEDCVDAELACGRHAALVGELLREVARHPLRERFRAQLMLALYRCGRQSEALASFRSARLLLREELGLEPGPGLRTLERAIHEENPCLDLQPPAGAGTHDSARPDMPSIPRFAAGSCGGT